MGDDLSTIRIGPLTLRDIVWLVSLVVALAGGYFAFEHRLSLSEERIKGYSQDSESMSEAIDRLNHFTTSAKEVNSINERRISQLEASFNIMSPRLERIDTNLQWLTRQSPEPRKP